VGSFPTRISRLHRVLRYELLDVRIRVYCKSLTYECVALHSRYITKLKRFLHPIEVNYIVYFIYCIVYCIVYSIVYEDRWSNVIVMYRHGYVSINGLTFVKQLVSVGQTKQKQNSASYYGY